MPVLPGTDGVEKMSKSLDNYIGITDPPREIFGKTMKIPDSLIYDYFVLTTAAGSEELAAIKKELESANVNPSHLKRRLARTLVAQYHSPGEAEAAEREFDRMFKDREAPDEMPEHAVNAPGGVIGIVPLLLESSLVASRNEARRMIEQGAVSVDGNRITDQNASITIGGGIVLRVGKRGFRRVYQVPQE